MKEIFESVDKKPLILSIILKILSTICWFMFAVIMVVFINGFLTKNKIICLVLSLFIVYTLRSLFKYYYRKYVYDSYYSIKNASELYYFKKLEKIEPYKIERMDKEYLANKILEVTYNLCRMVSDIFEYMIPLIIGLVIFFAVFSTVNVLLCLLLIVLIVLIMIYEFKHYEDEEATNYNDLLKDLVMKLPDIIMLNAFSFCYKKLEKNKNNSYCLFRNNNQYDIIYDISIIGVIFIAIISSVFIIRHSVDVLGVSLFILFMFIKLKQLLYDVVPTINNISNYKKNKIILESYFEDLKSERYVSDWKKIKFKDAVLTYPESNIDIKIPNFEFDRGDNVSILGESGQGKSTLLYLLSGIYKLNNGTIFIDGKATTQKIESIFITRFTKMFKISLRDNLTLGNKIEDEEILKLIKEIDVTEWYSKLPEGLDTIIDINYVELPDLVREKLNILRGIISNKETLFLDEATFDMEMDDEKIIANMIKKYWKKKSYIIVSHRPIFTTICKKHYFMKNHELLESEPLL